MWNILKRQPNPTYHCNIIFQFDFTCHGKKRGWFRCCKLKRCELSNAVSDGHNLHCFDVSDKAGTNAWVPKCVCVSFLEPNLKKPCPGGFNDSGIQKVSSLSLMSLQHPALNGLYLMPSLLKEKKKVFILYTESCFRKLFKHQTKLTY